jgi:hypothetical protein
MLLVVCVFLTERLWIIIDTAFRIGYYPPDHSIVTGDPESFNSWETLLCVCRLLIICGDAKESNDRDLAELLGQIKPPTASREEIERSGLEVAEPV